jgi:hypothetical protein
MLARDGRSSASSIPIGTPRVALLAAVLAGSLAGCAPVPEDLAGYYEGQGWWSNEVGEFEASLTLRLDVEGGRAAGPIYAEAGERSASATVRVLSVDADGTMVREYADCVGFMPEQEWGYGCPFHDPEWTVDRWTWEPPERIVIERGDADSEANQITARLVRIPDP